MAPGHAVHVHHGVRMVKQKAKSATKKKRATGVSRKRSTSARAAAGKGTAAKRTPSLATAPPAPPKKIPEDDAGPLEKSLGRVLRQHRLRNGLTLSELAAGTGISSAMLSRIETGAAMASFDTLSRVTKTMGLTLSALFRELEVPQGHAQLVKSGEGMEVVRSGTRKGYAYRLLAYSQGPQKLFDPFLITMDHESEVYPRFEHPGTEFMYILEGRMEYRHGDKVYLLEPGDTLTFSGEIVHGPEKLLDEYIKFLDIIVYGDGEAP